MKLIKHGKLSCLEPRWSDGGVEAGFTSRNGGISRPPYNSLNLGFNTDDVRYNVEGNRSTLCSAFNVPNNLLLTVKQVHGTDVLVIDEPNPDLSHFLNVECDAIVTNQPGIMAGVLVADCYPVLLFDPRQKVVAAVHVGWKGAASGIIEKVVKSMVSGFDSRAEDILAAIGPGIGAQKYEVDRPVREAFRAGTGNWERISKEVSLGKWHLDLKKSCRLQLEDAGIDPSSIDEAQECTYSHKELFFSYRRDNGETGRQLGYVLLK